MPKCNCHGTIGTKARTIELGKSCIPGKSSIFGCRTRRSFLLKLPLKLLGVGGAPGRSTMMSHENAAMEYQNNGFPTKIDVSFSAVGEVEDRCKEPTLPHENHSSLISVDGPPNAQASFLNTTLAVFCSSCSRSAWTGQV